MTEARLKEKLKEHRKARSAHERQEARLQRELARLALAGEKLWGNGSRSRVAALAGVHRVTVQTAVRREIERRERAA